MMPRGISLWTKEKIFPVGRKNSVVRNIRMRVAITSLLCKVFHVIRMAKINLNAARYVCSDYVSEKKDAYYVSLIMFIIIILLLLH